MPQTGAERNKKYREKIKSNAELSAAYKEKDRQRKKESRENNIHSPRKAAIEKKKVKDRVRLHRLKLATKVKSSANTEQIESKYVHKTPQSLRKAVKKVSRKLPSSPRKRKAVISKIVETTKLTFSKPKDPNGNNEIPATTIEEVKEFYFRDSIHASLQNEKTLSYPGTMERNQNSKKGT